MAEEKKKKPSSERKKKKKAQTWTRRHTLGLLIAGIAIVVALGVIGAFVFIPYSNKEENVWIYIPQNSTDEAVKDSLRVNLGPSMGRRVFTIWNLLGGTSSEAAGAYRISKGETALGISRRLKYGRQTPVKVSFNGVRTLEILAKKVSAQLQCSPKEFISACSQVLTDSGFTKEQFPAAFLPDTYELYWSYPADKIVKRLLSYRDKFWTPERLQKAKKLGLSPIEVATLASIVEEETAKTDERPKVARLYLNRLKKGMKLQADPTVKFATGNFELRRITNEHLGINSPYNTYKIQGLPPGPIRVVEGRTIDAVLDAPEHNYLYMCAREDFSGYHNFATDYATHMENARRYQAELNRRDIH